MKRKTYSEMITSKYVKSNLEDAKLFDYLDYKDPELETHYYDELNNIEVKGYPFSSDYVDKKGHVYNFLDYEKMSEELKKECRLRYLYLPHLHELYIGTTGSGKTTGCIEPQIRAISSQKNKPNLFITDPKGELFKRHAEHLTNQGYRVYILNFKDVNHSHMWNPLDEIYEAELAIKKIGKGYKLMKGAPKEGVLLVDPKEEYKDTYYLYQGKAFASSTSLNNFIDSEIYTQRTKVSSLVNQICRAMMPDTKANDPVWNEGARDLLYGIILCMTEEAGKDNTKFTREMMTMHTVNDIYALAHEYFNDSSDGRESKAKFDKFRKNKSTEANNKLSTVIKTASNTAKGFLSTFQSTISPWMKGHIFKLTAGTTIKLFEDDKPCVIFVCTRDYDKSDNVVASLFIDWAYRQALYEAERRDAEHLPLVDFHFLLDEFGNIPAISDFSNKISTARSRHIWFHLFVQSYDQLQAVYGGDTMGTILNNCNSTIFLGSQSIDTKKKFSEECGYKTVEALASMQTNEMVNELEQAPVVNISDLDKIQPGVMYIKRINTNVIKGGYIRGYQAAASGFFKHMFDVDPINTIAPFNSIVPDEDKRTYFPACPIWYKPKDKMKKVVEEEKIEEEVDLDDMDIGEEENLGDLDWETEISNYIKNLKGGKK